jgi:hypothetical protein
MNLTFPTFPPRLGEEMMLFRSMLPEESRLRLELAGDGGRTTYVFKGGSKLWMFSPSSRLELLTWCK